MNILKEINKSNTKRILFVVDEYKGIKSFRILEQWRNDELSEWSFSKKLISFNNLQTNDLFDIMNKEFKNNVCKLLAE